MPPLPTPPNRRLSKNSPRAAKGHKGGSSRGRGGRAVGRGRGAHRPQTGSQARVGAGRKEAYGQGQARIRVELPLWLRQAHYRRGVVADLAHRKQGTVLDGSRGVRQGGGSRQAQTHPFGPRSGRLAYLRRDRGSRRDTPRVPTHWLSEATTGGEVVASEQRGHSQPPLRGDLRSRRCVGGALRRTARSAPDHKGSDQLPLVAPVSMIRSKNPSAGFRITTREPLFIQSLK